MRAKPKRQWVVQFKAGREWQFLPDTFNSEKSAKKALAVWNKSFPWDKFRLRSLPQVNLI